MSELGEALRSAREEKGISLAELQETTKIQKRYLLAIEQGDYGQLPGRFYARAFIKSYAEAVGVNPDRLFEQYSSEVPKPQDDAEQLPSRKERRAEPISRSSRPSRPSGSVRRSSAVLPSILAAVVIIGLCVIIWMAFQRSGENGTGVADPSNGSVQYEQNKSLTNKQKDDSKKKKESSDTKKKSTDSTSNNKQQDKQNTTPKQVLTKTGETNGVVNYTLKNADQFQLKMAVTGGDCWINVSKSGPNGEHVVYGTLKSGQTITKDLSGTKQVYIKIGSTPHVKISINGEPFTYPSSDIVQKFLITVDQTEKAS
ncbi:MAG TPA: RodZ domain-containing protein [Bacillales bacterium]|nr:RodZ domain-containing protein [Bacillales bacterium]